MKTTLALIISIVIAAILYELSVAEDEGSEINGPRIADAYRIDREAPKTQSIADSTPLVDSAAPRAIAYPVIEVGSEGYGPHIRRALDSGTAAESSMAAATISRCGSIDKDVAAVYALGLDKRFADKNDGYVKTVEYIEQERRRCQTVTSDISELRPQLLLKAAEGKQFGAAANYINDGIRSGSGIDPQKRAAIIDALRADGQQGDTNSLLVLFSGDPSFSESPSDRRAYKLAYQLITTKEPDGVEFVLRSVMQTMVNMGIADGTESELLTREKMTADIEVKVRSIVAAHEQRSALAVGGG